jgi:hypothetical protein
VAHGSGSGKSSTSSDQGSRIRGLRNRSSPPPPGLLFALDILAPASPDLRNEPRVPHSLYGTLFDDLKGSLSTPFSLSLSLSPSLSLSLSLPLYLSISLPCLPSCDLTLSFFAQGSRCCPAIERREGPPRPCRHGAREFGPRSSSRGARGLLRKAHAALLERRWAEELARFAWQIADDAFSLLASAFLYFVLMSPCWGLGSAQGA